MQEEDMQQQMRDDKKFQRSRTNLDDEIDKLWMLMKRMSKKEYRKKRRKTNNDM